jgi:Domain of Unknown Function (DUF748)
VRARWGEVSYRERPSKAPKNAEARVGFAQVGGTLLNLTNRPTSAQQFAQLQLRAKFMGEASLALSVRFDLHSAEGAHEIEASGSDLALTDLNPVLEPTARVRVERGQMTQFELTANANDFYATGKMYFYYKDLKFSILDKKKQDKQTLKSRATALLANMLVRNRNFRSILSKGKRGTIFYERQPNRSIFSYWARIVLSGVVSSVTGIQKDLQDHIRQQEQEAQRELRQLLRQQMRPQNQVSPRRSGKKWEKKKNVIK